MKSSIIKIDKNLINERDSKFIKENISFVISVDNKDYNTVELDNHYRQKIKQKKK